MYELSAPEFLPLVPETFQLIYESKIATSRASLSGYLEIWGP